MPHFAPVLSSEELRIYEDFFAPQFAATRRRMLALLTVGSTELADAYSDADAADDMCDVVGRIRAYRKHLEYLIELADVTVARLTRVALTF